MEKASLSLIIIPLETLQNGKKKTPEILGSTTQPVLALELLPAEIWSQILVLCLQHESVLKAGQWHSELLRLRKVCVTFQQEMDRYLETHPHNYTLLHDHEFMNFKYTILDDNLIQGDHCTFRNPERLQKFAEHFNDTHKDRNPFLGRKIRFQDNFSEYRQVLRRQHKRKWNGFTNLLTLYGHHLHICAIHIDDLFLSRVDYFNKIRECLNLMPDLRFFEIYYSRTKSGKEVNPTPEELEELEGELIAKPFPKLEHLKLLQVTSLPEPVFKSLVATNNHIDGLEIAMGKNHTRYEFSSEMPNLTKLSLKFYSVVDVENLNQFADKWPRLTKLYLQFMYRPTRTSFAQWLQYLEIINKNWGENKKLVDLAIELPPLAEHPEEYLGQLNAVRLELPQLKRVQITMNSACTLDILLKLRILLELLDILGNYSELYYLTDKHCRRPVWDRGLTGTVEWLGKEKQMYDSNIWTLFPKLKKVSVKACDYTWDAMVFFRDTWEKRNSREDESSEKSIPK